MFGKFISWSKPAKSIKSGDQKCPILGESKAGRLKLKHRNANKNCAHCVKTRRTPTLPCVLLALVVKTQNPICEKRATSGYNNGHVQLQLSVGTWGWASHTPCYNPKIFWHSTLLTALPSAAVTCSSPEHLALASNNCWTCLEDEPPAHSPTEFIYKVKSSQ